MSSTVSNEGEEKPFLADMLSKLKSFKKDKRIRMHFLEDDMRYICQTARDIFLSEPILLEVVVPLRIVGDLHGQFTDLLRILESTGYPPTTTYLFLGDYVDRGRNSIETIILLLLLKVNFPKSIFLLRGNHEAQAINRVYGFFDECKRYYTIKMWKTFVDCYNCMPIAAIVSGRIFCCHGGLSPNLNELTDIARIERPTDIPEKGLLCDLLWADPNRNGFGWSPSDRGVSYLFGRDVLEKFLLKHDFDLVCRGHQVVEDGYEFFAKRQLVTIFSAPNYCGMFDNAGATMGVNIDMTISFEVLKPIESIISKRTME